MSPFQLRTKGPKDVQADQACPNLLRLVVSQLCVQNPGDVVFLDLPSQVV